MEHDPVEVVVRMIPTLLTVPGQKTFRLRIVMRTERQRTAESVTSLIGRAPRYHANAYRTRESVFVFFAVFCIWRIIFDKYYFIIIPRCVA